MKEFEIGKISKAGCEVNALFQIPLNEKEEKAEVFKNNSGMRKNNEKEENGECYGKFNYWMLVIALPASCVTYFDTTVMSLALPAATCDLSINDFNKGCLIGAAYAGMILSAFLWGFLSDKYGRRRLLVIGYFLDTLLNICASFSKNFTELLIFKFVGGMIVSGPYSIFMAYISEMFHGKQRDRVVMYVGIFISFGGIVQPTLAWLLIPLKFHWTFFNDALETNSWRMFMIVSTIPSFLSAFLFLFCVESPKFLMSKGRNEKALEVLKTIYSINSGKPRDTYPVKSLKDEQVHQPEFEEETPADSHKISHVLYRTWRQLTAIFRPPYASNALLVFAIQFGALMSLNNLRQWMPLLFHRIQKGSEKLADVTICEILELKESVSAPLPHLPCHTYTVDSFVYIQMICVSVASNLVFILGSFLAGKIKKRNFIICCYMVASVSSYTFVWVKAHYVLVMASIYLSAMLASTVGLIGIAVELFPTHLRAMAVSLTMTFGRLGVLIGSLTMPVFMNLNCWAPFTFVATIILCCASGLLYLTRKRK
ncbi:synaptic vesicle glycoprotein 2A-like isoform X4 [Nilaparvata lugens]|uniref:synaptic vesicle glycoprotein 2A-like isoform X3 n=1 Tax=Nilaparvata lugens TaxID=108931 RepID=UPI00193D9D52|nr:synaptic vesicle glycoprotein 2A-like isoform X3 [Nilaparvata lugens]XP_039290155.1 synaptic vesicle glycoprotein 2A-like isoform X4 [Nilaparvata lugens]